MTRYYWKKQDDNNSCGQLAVSIIVKKPVKEIYKLLKGYKSYTNAKIIIALLRYYGIRCDSNLQFTRKSDLAICKLTDTKDKNGYYHFIVIWKDKIFDGANGYRNGTVRWEKHWKITSYINIYQ